MMNYILPCVQNIIYTVFDAKEAKSKVAIKRYSSVDNTPPNQDKANMPQLFQQTLPNSYTQQKNAQVFIMPSVDAETDNQMNPGNLLINKCEQSSYVIMRSLQNVYVDSCSNGYIFMGPCHSTLFIRNCKNMKIRAIAQQLRIQNSQNISVQAIVGVRPVLQDCKNIKFSSLTCRVYSDLIWQMEKAKINIFDNQIYQCYDFTPKKQSNFTNLQNIGNVQIDNEWQNQIKLNDLDWGIKNVYLPKMIPVKKSMITRVYNESEIKNGTYVILFQKMNLKQLLVALNCEQLTKKITIIQQLNDKNSLKLLKTYSNYKQLINRVNKNVGIWNFLLVKMQQKIEHSKIDMHIIKDKQVIWKLFDIQNKDK